MVPLGLGSSLSKASVVRSASLILDTYTGAVAAYSLRSLKSGVTSVIKVRRSNDDAHADFTASEITDGTLTTWTGSNDGFVNTLYDQSGNGNHGVVASDALEPKLVNSGSVLTSGNSSKPAFHFDGSNDFIPLGDFSDALNINNLSSFAVFEPDDVSSDESQILMLGGSAGGNKRWFFKTKSGNLEFSYAGTGNPIADFNTTANNDQNLVSMIAGSTLGGFRPFLNGTALGSGSVSVVSNSNDSTDASLGGQGGSGVWAFDGLMSEIIVYGSDQSANRTEIEGNITDYYGI
jgi:hypothetical protein